MSRFAGFMAIVWVALTGDVSLGNVVFAVLLGMAVTHLARPLGTPPVFARFRPFAALRFGVFVAAEIFVANLRVAAAVLGPRRLISPAVVAVPLDLTRDDEITLLAGIINLTPGTLSLDVSPDRRTLLVHSMFTDSPDALRASIKNGYERRIKQVLA
jgi:multicomponent Na+:H+ antiporter subunit E